MSHSLLELEPRQALENTDPDRPAGSQPRFRLEKWLAAAAPYLFGLLFLGGWELIVCARAVPAFLLPAPSLIAATLVKDFPLLATSLIFTLKTAVLAFLLASAGGLFLGLLFALSPWIERTLFPYAVILQVTPVVAIAPLIIIWANDTQAALLICAWIVAFFPIVSNTVTGLNSTDRNLIDLYRLYGASKMQTLMLLKLPSALPYYLAGMRISGGLSLIGAVVAEFVAGTGGTESGLAYRILESGYKLQIPRMFAALFLISVSGILIFACLSSFSRILLRNWHDSAIH
jgi:NitT/TauT family transport system permease protein